VGGLESLAADSASPARTPASSARSARGCAGNSKAHEESWERERAQKGSELLNLESAEPRGPPCQPLYRRSEAVAGQILSLGFEAVLSVCQTDVCAHTFGAISVTFAAVLG